MNKILLRHLICTVLLSTLVASFYSRPASAATSATASPSVGQVALPLYLYNYTPYFVVDVIVTMGSQSQYFDYLSPNTGPSHTSQLFVTSQWTPITVKGTAYIHDTYQTVTCTGQVKSGFRDVEIPFLAPNYYAPPVVCEIVQAYPIVGKPSPVRP